MFIRYMQTLLFQIVFYIVSQEDTLISLYNNYINSWNWNVVEGDGVSHINLNPSIDSTYIHLFESYGNSDVTLTLTSEHGCSDDTTYTDVIYVNNYTAVIADAPDSICFQGSATTIQDFSAEIISDSLGIDYEVIAYDWSIISSNSNSAIQTPIDSLNVRYTFSEPGVYRLMYSATIDGSNTDCEYTDTIEFNVGVDASIVSSPIICVGGNTFSASYNGLDTWSDTLSYLWSTTSDLVIADTTASSTSISSETSVLPDSTLVYDLNLKVTNDVGCWEEDSVDIDVYQVHADFTVSDSVLHCLSQEDTLISLYNNYINSWNWNVVEGDGVSHINLNPSIDSTYIHLFESYGNSDVTLTLTSEHGCSDDTTYTDVIYVNNYTAVISDAPDSICFQGSATTIQDFSAEIISDSLGIDYEVIAYDWSIISSNSNSAIQTPIDSLNVRYTFSEPGVYRLMYSATIDGSNTDCEYTDTIEFNVGVDASIVSSPIICVGGNTFSASYNGLDTWSDTLSYLWSTTSDLVIADTTASSTSISSETSVLPDSTLVYDLNLKVTNDVGCWEEDSVDIDVYQVHADFTVSDSVLHCLSQEDTLISLYNNYINSWNWNVVEGDGVSHINLNPSIDSTYIHLFESYGNSDVTLTLTSEHGCSDDTTYTDVIYVNNYTAVIADAPDSICFQGSATTIQDFSAEIISDSLGIDYEVIAYDWSIISSNSNSAIQTPIDSLNVRYTFSEPGVYRLMYSATIDGSNTDCEYTDTIEFNVGVDASIVSSPIICVGGNTFSASYNGLDTWSDTLSYLWSTTSDLVIADTTASSTSISSETSVLPDSTLVYDLNLKVTNDVGCWEEDSVDIDVYQVHADFTVSDSVLHCLSQEDTLISLYNNYINSWNWNVVEGDGVSHINLNPSIDSTYIHLFESYGNSDVTLTLTSEHGCSDDTTYTDVIYVNNYTAVIADAPDSICFQGSATTIQDFSAEIISDSLGIDYEVIAYDWSIISSNSNSAIQTPIDSLNVRYTFSESGVYRLMYSATIDGSNTDCEYTDTIEFNVGVDASIVSSPIICVGGNTFSASYNGLDTWSDTLSYLWSTTSDLVIADTTASSTSISSETSVLPDSTLVMI